MKLKKMIPWLLAAALILVASFFLPRIFLHHREQKALREISLREARGLTQEDLRLGTVEKLQILAMDSYNSFFINHKPETDAESKNRILGEMDRAFRENVLSPYLEAKSPIETLTLFEEIRQTMMEPLPYIYADDHRLMEIYEIYGDGMGLVADGETGLILELNHWAQDDLIDGKMYHMLHVREPDYLEDWIRSCGAYYGLEVSSVQVCSYGHLLKTGLMPVVTAVFSDESGNRVGFGLCYVFEENDPVANLCARPLDSQAVLDFQQTVADFEASEGEKGTNLS